MYSIIDNTNCTYALICNMYVGNAGVERNNIFSEIGRGNRKWSAIIVDSGYNYNVVDDLAKYTGTVRNCVCAAVLSYAVEVSEVASHNPSSVGYRTVAERAMNKVLPHQSCTHSSLIQRTRIAPLTFLIAAIHYRRSYRNRLASFPVHSAVKIFA